MANELQFFGDPLTQTGLTIVIDIYDNSLVLVVNNLTTAEVPGEAIYYASMPALPAGNYSVRFYDTVAMIAQGSILWDGVKEIDSDMLIDELHKIQGLDSNTPMTMVPGQRTAGTIVLDVSGDGETVSVVTRT